MPVISCDSSYAGPILEIFNDAILHSTALYDYKPRTAEMMTAWFEAKRKGNYPVIGVVDDHGELQGFASYGSFRAWPAYKYSVEHSVYVAEKFRRCGLARLLLGELIQAAESQNYHAMIGVIDSQNRPSIALHEQMGFVHGGTLRQVGFKFGRWLDIDFYQRILTTPKEPADG
jgi:L-amino acid N-acyltransferase YncA